MSRSFLFLGGEGGQTHESLTAFTIGLTIKFLKTCERERKAKMISPCSDPVVRKRMGPKTTGQEKIGTRTRGAYPPHFDTNAAHCTSLSHSHAMNPSKKRGW